MRLHKEHGVNPTISVCIICGEDKGEIVLLGAEYKGQAPMKMITSVEPCDKCREKYLEKGKGVMILETTADSTKDKPVPTGSLKIIKDKAFKQIVNAPIPPRRICFVPKEVFDYIDKCFENSKK